MINLKLLSTHKDLCYILHHQVERYTDFYTYIYFLLFYIKISCARTIEIVNLPERFWHTAFLRGLKSTDKPKLLQCASVFI